MGMIFYFSGTGNSRWVARTLADRMRDRACDLIGLDPIPDLQGESRVGCIRHIQRGYEDIARDLRALGAEIREQ